MKNGAESGWKGTIAEQRTELNQEFEDSKNLMIYAKEILPKAYSKARVIASAETGLPVSKFPEDSPFSFEQVVDENYLPE